MRDRCAQANDTTLIDIITINCARNFCSVRIHFWNKTLDVKLKSCQNDNKEKIYLQNLFFSQR